MQLQQRQSALYAYPDFFARPVWTTRPFRARITTTQRSAMELQVTDVSGDWPLPDTVAYVGTESNPFLHVTRVRRVDRANAKIFVAENEIDFSQHNWLYCPHLFVVLPKFQRVADVSGTPTVWKDYDLAPQPLPPKVNVTGPYHAAAGESVVLNLSWRNMEHGSSGASVEVSVPGGTATRVGNSLLVTCQLPGFRYVSVYVTDSAGRGAFHFPLFVATPRYRPFVRGGVMEIDRGWTLDVEIPFPPDETPYVEPYHVVAFRYDNRWWFGFVSAHDVDVDYRYRKLYFSVRSSVAELDNLRSHAFSLEDGARDSWYKLPELTVARAAHLLLEFHSTFNLVTPVTYDSICDRRLKSNAFHDGSLLSQLTDDLLRDLLASVIQDTNGAVTVTRRPNLRWDRSNVQVVDVASAEVSVARGTKLGLVKAGGFAYDTPLLSRAPGTTPGYNARTEEREGLIVESQEDLNRCAGLILADENAGDVHASLFGDVALHSVLPGVQFYRFGNVVADVLSVRVRAEGTALLCEVEGKERSVAVAGETIVVPPPPEPYVPQLPTPPEPSPSPFVRTGIALVRARQFVVRSLNVYSYYPYWEIVFNSTLYDGQPDSRVIDFRYVERGGFVAVLVLTNYGNIYWTPDISATPVSWSLLLGRTTLQQLLGTASVEVFNLMTFVHDGNYVGLSAVAHYPDHSKRTYYVYSRNFGGSWNASIVRSGDFVYAHKPVTLFNTAGTEQLYMLTSSGIVATHTRIYRSENGGATWAYDGATRGPTFPTFKSYKPWQYGTGGRIVYSQPNVFNDEYRLAKSTNGCETWTELIPSSSSYWPGQHSFEVWTFDPLHVVCALRSKTPPHSITFFASRDGGSSWSTTTTTIQSAHSNAPISVRGNPANRDEWTVLDTTPTEGGQRGIVRLVQTLDGGRSWRSLMGNWYDVPGLYIVSGTRTIYWFGEDYLITPPFSVVRESDLR